ncbi:MAG: methionyl-tRNA formyltransferase [Candidatus Omnitrophica bacterium]|nr:methionyl-tRNA formyltransferase [Candidatus Omnitrophota bacterium]
MRILFFGCDDFAAISFHRLIHSGHKLLGLVTQPDKPKGRGMHVVYSDTKQVALNHGIEVFQPANLKEAVVVEKLRSFNADVFVVIAYGQFFPDNVLTIPKTFCLNVHGSLLPKYRGAAPINWAVINGEIETGITFIKMNSAMDGGDIVGCATCPILENTTSFELRNKLAQMSAELLPDVVSKIKAGDFTFEKQNDALATRAPKMHKDLGHIHWDLSAKRIHDLVRGVQPWPGAFTFWRGNRLKILDAISSDASLRGKPGEIVELHKDGFYVQAADRAVLVRRVHPASSKPMDARSFLAGHKLAVGEVLG